MLLNISINIPVFFIAFILFIVVINLALRKNEREQESVKDAFWERERRANLTRKKDISNLPYITIPPEIIPQNPQSDSERELYALSDRQILNLTGKTNTELKLEYGVSNFEVLCRADENFTQLVNALLHYTSDLLESCPDSPSESTGIAGTADIKEKALRALEFAVEIKADAKPLYIRLAKLYQEDGHSDKIEQLIHSAEQLQTLSRDAIVQALRQIIS